MGKRDTGRPGRQPGMLLKTSFHQNVKQMVKEIVAGWAGQVTDVYVPYSDRLIIENIVQDTGNGFKIHGCDTRLYDTIVGRFLAGTPMRIALNPEYRSILGWLEPYLEASPVSAAATVLLGLDLTALIDSQGVPRQTEYYVRYAKNYQSQWPKLHGRVLNKLDNYPLRFDSYHCGDIMDWMNNVPDNAGVVTFPGFFKTKTPQREWGKLERIFRWETPLTGNMMEGFPYLEREFMAKVQQRDHWCFLSPNQMERGEDEEETAYYNQHLKGRCKPENRASWTYIYASKGAARLVTPQQHLQKVGLPYLGHHQEVGNKLEIRLLTYPQFCYMRSQFMNPGIRPGRPTQAFAVVVDDILCGAFAILAMQDKPKYIEPLIAGPSIYLMSDFPVAPVGYKNLAKLMLYAALSKEARILYERIARKRLRSITTTAFSKNPVSMKYRGLFDLLIRKENDSLKKLSFAKDINPNDAYFTRPYDLEYGSELGRWTLDEALLLWKKKYGQFSLNEMSRVGVGDE